MATQKETGQLKGYAQMRKYDLIDLFSISVYNLTIFSSGVALGWYMWHVST